MSSKLSKTHYFVFTCLFIGIIGSIIQQEFWTSRALAETTLILFSLCYLISKYFASKIIRKYQDYGYMPNKSRKFRDALIVESGFHIAMPVSLCLLYAACILLVLKYLPSGFYKTIGNLVNPVIEFNKKYISYPVTLLIIVLGILTLIRYVSVKRFKSFQNFSKYIAFPFEVAFTLSFFLVADKGLNNNLLAYEFNSQQVKAQALTFNASTANNNQEKEIENAYNEFASYVLERLNNIYNQDKSEEDQEEPGITIYPNATKLRSLINQFPQIHSEVAENVKRNPSYVTGSNETTFNDFHQTVWTQTEATVASSNLHEEALTKKSTFFSDFFQMIADERTRLNKVALSEDAEIIQKLMGDLWGEFFPAEKITNFIPIHKIVKDKAFDLFNEKLMNCFYSFIRKKQISKDDVAKLNNYIDNILSNDFKAAIKSVKNKFKLFIIYNSELNKAATDSYYDNLAKSTDQSIISYEDGLVKRKATLEIQKEKWRTKDLTEFMNEMRERYPSYSDDELKKQLEINRDYLISKLDNKITEINHGLSNKEKLREFEYIKNAFSSGGIFFGHSISADLTTPCSPNFYPTIPNCPISILNKKIIAAEVINDKLIIKTQGGSYESESKISRNLLLGAYNYVYSKNTYPVLIDGFYDENDNHLFSYNRNITYDTRLLKTLTLADKFIFDVLHDSVDDAEVKNKFSRAVANYKLPQKDVELSRIYDETYYVSTTPQSKFNINAKLIFSVVSKIKTEKYTDNKYRELSEFSADFNTNNTWLLNRFSYLNEVATFASYQALFRTVDRANVDISELILNK